MKVSFVIPAHNESAILARCIDHLRRNKDYIVHEIIVVLSSETNDESEQLLSRMSIRWAKSQATSRAIQMNEGARLASGNVICFVHADVCLPINSITFIASCLKDGYKAGYFSYRFDKISPLLKINARLTRKDGLFSGGGDQSLFIFKKTFEQLGGYDESCVIMEDFEFFDRLKANNIMYTILAHDAIVSARKYKDNSYFRVNIVNGLIFSMYKLGTPTPVLKKWYSRLLN